MMFERVKVVQINEHIWLMNDADEATGYLVAGSKKAVVIDTMNGYENVKAIARTLTSLPLTVVNTHGHPDHIFGNVYFDEAYLHPDDWKLAEKYITIPEFREAIGTRDLRFPPLLPVKEGNVFDLGGVSLEVYHIPGHTPGGICLLDQEDRILFTGDSIIEQTWMQMKESLPIPVFFEALNKITIIRDKFDYILTGHTREKLEDASLCEVHKKAVQEVMEGKTEKDVSYSWFGGAAKAHPYGKESRRIVYKEDVNEAWKEK